MENELAYLEWAEEAQVPSPDRGWQNYHPKSANKHKSGPDGECKYPWCKTQRNWLENQQSANLFCPGIRVFKVGNGNWHSWAARFVICKSILVKARDLSLKRKEREGSKFLMVISVRLWTLNSLVSNFNRKAFNRYLRGYKFLGFYADLHQSGAT